ncbi:2-dehydropantoate 2-reductase [Corynebacterium sp. 13CS0277]|uniref:2-dehydropantoate 2-reductase n=1 Tax=Corynebacterium sp. 13CS0277 TaxID=2071994 RepID=UPI001304EEC4|nr:2-dehydropantoate 2-reductase [Corynebacterium sp. 13CS0277]
MRIAIVGAGAVGGTFGARLSAAGHEVTFIARGTTLERLQRQGLTFTDLGETATYRIPTVATLAEVDRPECVILATKALGENVVASGVFDGVEPLPVVLTQNSVEAPGRIADALGTVWPTTPGEHWVIPGVVRGFMHYQAPAEVAFLPGPLSLTVGPLPGTGQAARAAARRLMDAFHVADMGGEYREDILVDVWMKAMFVATFGALGCAARARLGVLLAGRADGGLREQFIALIDEVARTGRACGVPLAEDAVAATVRFAEGLDPSSTTSMQRDFLDGLPCEFDAQLPAVVRMAARAGVQVPTAAAVCGLVELELARRAGRQPQALQAGER